MRLSHILIDSWENWVPSCLEIWDLMRRGWITRIGLGREMGSWQGVVDMIHEVRMSLNESYIGILNAA